MVTITKKNWKWVIFALISLPFYAGLIILISKIYSFLLSFKYLALILPNLDQFSGGNRYRLESLFAFLWLMFILLIYTIIDNRSKNKIIR